MRKWLLKAFLFLVLGACGGVLRMQERIPEIVELGQPRSNNAARVAANPELRREQGVGSGSDQQAGAGRPGTGQSYRVKAGDTLYSIAFARDMDFRRLADANGLQPPYRIYAGEDLNLDLAQVVQHGQRGGGGASTSPPDNRVTPARESALLPVEPSLRQEVAPADEDIRWQWPHRGALLRGFGRDGNKGMDIGGQLGDPVLAAAAGDVVYSGGGVPGSGQLIIIRHNERYLSAYAHNSAMLVSEGSRVRAGEQIAELGLSPSGAAMLRFEIRVDGKSVDPSRVLPGR